MTGEPGSADTKTVLLVEDEAVVRSMTAGILRGVGYEVLEVGDPAEARSLAALFPGPIDVLLAAVTLRGCSGLDLADAVRRLRPDVQVVFFSGLHAGAVDRARIAQLRASVLPKPFRLEDLTTAVARAVAS